MQFFKKNYLMKNCFIFPMKSILGLINF